MTIARKIDFLTEQLELEEPSISPVKKKKKKKSNRCKNCRKKKGAYLLICKCCNKKYCISCLDVNIHNCKFKDEYYQKKKEKLECELISADSNFSKIDKI